MEDGGKKANWVFVIEFQESIEFVANYFLFVLKMKVIKNIFLQIL